MTTPARTAEIVEWGKVDPGGVVQAVRVKCPFCAAVHVHGWPLTTPETRWIERAARCGRGHYVIGQAEPVALDFTPPNRGPSAA